MGSEFRRRSAPHPRVLITSSSVPSPRKRSSSGTPATARHPVQTARSISTGSRSTRKRMVRALAPFYLERLNEGSKDTTLACWS